MGQPWWPAPIISAFGRQKQEDEEFEAGPGYRVKPCQEGRNKGRKAERERGREGEKE
jgi:hypothetical protein